VADQPAAGPAAVAPVPPADGAQRRVGPFDVILDLCDPDNPRVITNGHDTAASAQPQDHLR
jgi:hypothetical protein